MLRSTCLARMWPPKHTVYLSYKGAYGPAVLPGNSLFKLTLAGCQRNQAVRNLTYSPHAACGYCIKLQRWEDTERCTPENTDNNIWKIPIRLTSVGLAQARLNYILLWFVEHKPCSVLTVCLFLHQQVLLLVHSVKHKIIITSGIGTDIPLLWG